MQESFYREGLFEDTLSFCALHDSVLELLRHSRGKLEEIFKDIFAGYMKAMGLNVDSVIKGLLRNRQ